MSKHYVGDGVYAEIAQYASGDLIITLTSENGVKVLSTIVLEPEVWSALTGIVNAVAHSAAREPREVGDVL